LQVAPAIGWETQGMTESDSSPGSGRGHAFFAVLNRTVNPIVRHILHSRAHRPLSGQLLILTVTGRRSGREHSFPVGHAEADGVLTIQVGSPGRKRWWRNIGSRTPVLGRAKRHLGRDRARGRRRGLRILVAAAFPSTAEAARADHHFSWSSIARS
jgi:hypothetical protein